MVLRKISIYRITLKNTGNVQFNFLKVLIRSNFLSETTLKVKDYTTFTLKFACTQKKNTSL